MFCRTSDMNTETVMISANPELPRKKPLQKGIGRSRKQELSLRLNQLVSAVLLVLSLWIAHTLRRYIGQFDGIVQIGPFKAFLWLIMPILTCGPMLLELH